MTATTQDAKLVSMANQISVFFRSYPEAEACAGIRQHIKAFWTPRMCRSILAGPQDGMDPLVAMALRGWGQGESPVSKQTGGPHLVGPAVNGAMASDAG